MFINLCVFRVADFSHFRDAELDRGCSADVSSPPRASWGVMKEPALPSTRTVYASVCIHEDHQLL